MSKQSYITRYRLIIKRLQKSPADFTQLCRYLERESEIRGYDYTMSLRTFQREIKEIEKLGYLIKYVKSTRAYFIEDLENNQDQNVRILEAFEMLDLVKSAGTHSEHIQFEKRKPQGLHHFQGLLHAIRNRKLIKVEYLKFYTDEPCFRELYPIYLKEFKGRWYLIAKDKSDTYVKTYGLDRITDLEITKISFPKEETKESKNYNDCFGVIKPSEGTPQKIMLSFSALQGKYVKSLPLHDSQTILKDTDKELIIELRLFITHDFLMELMSYGNTLTVLSPSSLIKDIKNAYQAALTNYT